jgi:plastocyanin
MDSFDSRSLRYVDCYAQRFAEPGTVRYELTTPAGSCMPLGDDGYTIEVAEAPKRKGVQHTVVVRRLEGELRPEPDHLEIEAGDMVLWNTPDATIPGYVVRGEGAGGSFDSSALRREAVYTHAFGTPGTYRWVDAHGGKLTGEVVVETVECQDADELARWHKRLAKGTLITLRGSEARPARVKIVTGQTVFWAVESADGITITDSRLLTKPPAPSEDEPAPEGARTTRQRKPRSRARR